MTVHYISGSSVNNNKSSISMANVSSRTDTTEVVQTNPEKRDNQAKANKDAGTIQRTSPDAVAGISDLNGYVGINISAAPTEGTSIQVAGASYPFSGSYGIVSTSGNWAITDVPYVSCTGIGALGTFTLDSGALDTIVQRQFIMMKSTTSLGGVANDALKFNKSNGSASLHPFGSYRSRVYATGWQAFTGDVSKCNITTTVVTPSGDDNLTNNTVIIAVAGKPKASDITNPETAGLRDPS